MFEWIIMQASNSFVDASWAAIATITTGVTVVSGIAIFWVNKLRAALKNSKNESAKKLVSVLEKYVVPVLEQGQKVAEITAKQEVKAKQFGEILYATMGDKANEIKDKYEVKLVNLSKDVDTAIKGTEEYNNKIKEMEELLEQIKNQVATGQTS